MPNCGSQCYLCDVPIRFDTYDGCSHGCEYCFAKKFRDISKIKNGESAETLRKFIEGKRGEDTKWCDWSIPLHWGGMSDPFQPCEKMRGVSLQCLKVLAETQYPFIVSTKGKLILDERYMSLLEKCNCVLQISLVCDKYDKLEQGAPTFDERLEMIREASKRVKRVVVRIQPYMHEVFKDVFDNLAKFKEAGAYGVIVEGLKFKSKKQGLVKLGGDMVYPYSVLYNDFMKLKAEAHRLGLKFYSGENRLRKLGDSLCCCGIDGLDDFKPNTYNLNHILNGDKPVATERQTQVGTAGCFGSLFQTTVGHNLLKQKSFKVQMLEYYKNNKDSINRVMGVNKK